MRDLADDVAVRAHGKPLEDIPEDDVIRLLHRLHHTHLPMLQEADMVERQRYGATVTTGDAVELAIPFLQLAEDTAANTD